MKLCWDEKQFICIASHCPSSVNLQKRMPPPHAGQKMQGNLLKQSTVASTSLYFPCLLPWRYLFLLTSSFFSPSLLWRKGTKYARLGNGLIYPEIKPWAQTSFCSVYFSINSSYFPRAGVGQRLLQLVCFLSFWRGTFAWTADSERWNKPMHSEILVCGLYGFYFSASSRLPPWTWSPLTALGFWTL